MVNGQYKNKCTSCVNLNIMNYWYTIGAFVFFGRRKKRILTSINHLTENTKQMRKSKALLIVGEYGVGKSSFVNTVLTAITGIYHEHCEVAQASSSKTNYLDV